MYRIGEIYTSILLRSWQVSYCILFGKGYLRYKKGIQMLKKGFRSIGKFAKKLILCQGHFHHTG